MNKKMTFVSTVVLLLATSASAQVISILPGGRGNLYIGTPTTLPGPMGNIVISPRISLPAPLLAPSISMTAAPTPMIAALPVLAIASPIPALPAAAIPQQRILAVQENVAMPNPALRAKFAAPAKDASTKEAARENLDHLFDNRPAPKNDDRSPVRSDRHQSLPEQDLESEIGAY